MHLEANGRFFLQPLPSLPAGAKVEAGGSGGPFTPWPALARQAAIFSKGAGTKQGLTVKNRKPLFLLVELIGIEPTTS